MVMPRAAEGQRLGRAVADRERHRAGQRGKRAVVGGVDIGVGGRRKAERGADCAADRDAARRVELQFAAGVGTRGRRAHRGGGNGGGEIGDAGEGACHGVRVGGDVAQRRGIGAVIQGKLAAVDGGIIGDGKLCPGNDIAADSEGCGVVAAADGDRPGTVGDKTGAEISLQQRGKAGSVVELASARTWRPLECIGLGCTGAVLDGDGIAVGEAGNARSVDDDVADLRAGQAAGDDASVEELVVRVVSALIVAVPVAAVRS